MILVFFTYNLFYSTGEIFDAYGHGFSSGLITSCISLINL